MKDYTLLYLAALGAAAWLLWNKFGVSVSAALAADSSQRATNYNFGSIIGSVVERGASDGVSGVIRAAQGFNEAAAAGVLDPFNQRPTVHRNDTSLPRTFVL
ncbi:MAG: hypothetical protein AAB368_13975 [bacterium]